MYHVKCRAIRVYACIPIWKIVKPTLTGIALFLMGVWLVTAVSATPPTTNWTFPDRSYRMPLTVQANGYARTDKIVELDVDFQVRLTDLGETGSFDEDSLRVAEVDAAGNVLDNAVPFQFDNGSTVDAPSGTLIFLLTGTTVAANSRYYQVYFDATGTFTAPPAITDRVDKQADVTWQGQSSYKIITRDTDGTTNTTYYYHKEGAGFAGVIDRDGHDWISFQPGAGTKSGGEYRGIPNLGKVFHPGYDQDGNATSLQGSNSTVLDDGPLRLTFQSTSYDGNYQAVWAIYPTFAQMTVSVAGGENYWMLYEGTPGGELNYSSAPRDYLVMSDGSQINVSQQLDSDLNQDWAYFADGVIDRSLFVIHGPNDNITDSYRRLDDFSNGSDADAMTVLGFGRTLSPWTNRLLTASASTYTFGLVEDRDYVNVAGVINNANQNLIVTAGNEVPTIDTNAGLTAHEGETAVLSGSHLTTTDPEGGKITYVVISPPANGALLRVDTPLGIGGSFTQADIDSGVVSYQHDGGVSSSDSITFTASDGTHVLSSFPFDVTITAVNAPPTATADDATVVAGQSIIIDLVANDNDTDDTDLFVTNLTEPVHGEVVNNGDGTVTYSVDLTYAGSDTFTYRATDGAATSATATVTVTVLPSQKVYLPLVISP